MAVRTISILNIKITASTKEMRKDLRDAQIMLGKFTGVVKRATIAVAKLATVAAAAFVGWGIKLASELETATVGFTTLLKSEEKALALLKEIKAFAGATPFQSKELIQAGKVLLAFGVEAGNVVKTLKELGDAASGSGSNLSELVAVYGKILASGKLTGETLLQLQERAIPIVRALADELGKTEAQIREMITAGNITSANVVSAFQRMSAAGGAFFGSTEAQSKTLAGLWSTMKDNVELLAEEIGTVLIPAMKDFVEWGIKVVKWLKSITLEQVKTVAQIAAMVAAFGLVISLAPKIVAVVMLLIKAWRTLSAAQILVLALGGPAGIATLVAGLAAAGAAFLVVDHIFVQLQNSVSAAQTDAEKMAKALKGTGDAAAETAAVVAKLKEGMDDFTDPKKIEALKKELAGLKDAAAPIGSVGQRSFGGTRGTRGANDAVNQAINNRREQLRQDKALAKKQIEIDKERNRLLEEITEEIKKPREPPVEVKETTLVG